MSISKILPKKFLGFLPLYIGVELILLYGVINKMCGPYGLLSLLTGHPINFIQWVYYLASTVFLCFFLVGFQSVTHPDINTFSLVVMLYLVDTLAGCLFTVYFVWFWFANESKEKTPEKPAVESAQLAQRLVKRVSEDLASQSASESYELFVTVTMTLLTTAVRFYFTLVMLSFFKEMVSQSKYNTRFRLTTTADGRFHGAIVKLEVWCYNALNRIVR